MIQSTDYQVYTNEKKIPETTSWFRNVREFTLGVAFALSMAYCSST
jgi:hypothetical protein